MTKKDYILIAEALKPFYQDMVTLEDENGDEQQPDILTVFHLVKAISKALSKDNPKFNPVKFLEYLRSK